ncbi:MAG: hypothetical protein QM534_14485 [Sediminibacterium sp.]|nr:hypothetical protein [Sediminibacterium sp.]
MSSVKLADTSEAKIGEWSKKINGKKSDVEIYAYYETSDFKKFSQERLDEVYMVVIRKARDYVNVKDSKVVKGKKSQRNMVDIVYSNSMESGGQSASTESTGKKDSETKEVKESKPKQGVATKSEPAKQETNSKPSTNTVNKGGGSDYIYDSVYVNGVLKVTKIKVKKK